MWELNLHYSYDCYTKINFHTRLVCRFTHSIILSSCCISKIMCLSGRSFLVGNNVHDCVNRWIIVMEWDMGIRLSNQKCKIVEMACAMKSTYSQLGISIFLMKLSKYLNSETADFLLMSLSFHGWLCMKTRSTFTRGWWRLHWHFHKFKVCVLWRSTLSVFHSKLYRHVDSEMHTYDIATLLIALLLI